MNTATVVTAVRGIRSHVTRLLVLGLALVAVASIVTPAAATPSGATAPTAPTRVGDPIETTSPPLRSSGSTESATTPVDVPGIPDGSATTRKPGLSDVPTEAPTPYEPGEDDDRPHIVVSPKCDPAGFSYELILPLDAPMGVYEARWRVAPDGVVQSEGPGSQSGFVQTGTGDYQVGGVLKVDGVIVFTFPWRDVTVSCRTLVAPERPTVEIAVEPRCEPLEGIVYEITTGPMLDDILIFEAQWRESGGPVQVVAGQQGFIPTGEGTFEVRGKMTVLNHGFTVTGTSEVTVDCPDDVPDDDTPGDDVPGDDEPGDDPRPGTPTFTG